jgi:hypothetical protein
MLNKIEHHYYRKIQRNCRNLRTNIGLFEAAMYKFSFLVR